MTVERPARLGKGEGGVLLNGELSGSLEMKSDSKTKQRRLQDKAE